MRDIPVSERAGEIVAAYRAGRITLSGVIRWSMIGRIPIPEELEAAVFDAFDAYEMGFTRDLAEAFGIAEPLSRRKAGKLTKESVRELVDFLHESAGLPMTNPALAKGETAFHEAAQQLCVSPTTVHRYYYAK